MNGTKHNTPSNADWCDHGRGWSIDCEDCGRRAGDRGSDGLLSNHAVRVRLEMLEHKVFGSEPLQTDDERYRHHNSVEDLKRVGATWPKGPQNPATERQETANAELTSESLRKMLARIATAEGRDFLAKIPGRAFESVVTELLLWRSGKHPRALKVQGATCPRDPVDYVDLGSAMFSD